MVQTSKKIFIFAGEPSGDLHGSRLAQILKIKAPEISITGVSGPKMRQESVRGPLIMEDFEVMGLTDVILALPKLYRHFHTVRNSILHSAPDAVVLIDYPGFNLRMAKALRKKEFKGKIIHYISPSVWAHGKHRIVEMEKTLDMLLTIYPFEAAHFSKTNLNVNYVGSPLQEYLSQYNYQNDWKTKLGIPDTKKLVAIFPGSRKGEIARNLPLILEATEMLIQNDPDIIFGISCFNEATKSFLETHTGTYPHLKDALYQIPKKYSYELMRDSRCAIAKSGTVTLELALHKCPTVVVYKLSTINYIYAKHILRLKLPHYCIVNILAQREVFPELIEHGLDSPNIYKQVKSLLEDGEKRCSCIQSCHEIDSSLGTNDANTKASEAILRCMQC